MKNENNNLFMELLEEYKKIPNRKAYPEIDIFLHQNKDDILTAIELNISTEMIYNKIIFKTNSKISYKTLLKKLYALKNQSDETATIMDKAILKTMQEEYLLQENKEKEVTKNEIINNKIDNETRNNITNTTTNNITTSQNSNNITSDENTNIENKELTARERWKLKEQAFREKFKNGSVDIQADQPKFEWKPSGLE